MATYRLGDIAPIQQGVVPNNDQYWLLNLDMVESNTGKVLDFLYVDDSQIGTSTISFDQNNVLYSKLRPYLNKVVLPDRAGYATSEMLPLKPDEKIIIREYLSYFLRSPHFVKYINEKTSGAKMPRANIADLKTYEIDCPSVMEQQRIVSQFNSISRIIQTRQQQLSALDDLIKARFVELYETAELSEETTVEAITTRVKVGFVGTCEKYYTDQSGVPMLRTGNITENGIDLADLKYVTNEFNAKNKKSQIHEGDLLIARHGSNGQANVYHGPEAQCLNAVVIVPDYRMATPVFLAGLINSPMVKTQIDRTLVGSTQHVVNTKSIASLKVRVPQMAVQNEYEQFVAQVDKSKVAVQKALNEAQLLFDSLMQQYFG